MSARLRHVAVVVKDLQKAARFYETAFELKRVGEETLDFADAIYLTDGVINLALLNYKGERGSGLKNWKEFVGAHHFGFQVDDLAETQKRIEAAGGKFFFDLGLEEFDAMALEHEVTAARRALKRQAGGAATELERALARYRGDFLDGEPVGDWHVEHRERLQRLYVDALMELAGHYADEERYARAAELYRRVLARDELHEEALRALMHCLAEAGDRSQALRAYRRFADRLRAELEAEPEEETTRLLTRLQAS